MNNKITSNNPDWLDLPREILSMIFTMISLVDRLINVCHVCKAWRAIVLDTTGFTSLGVSGTSRSMNVTDSIGDNSYALFRIANKYGLFRIAFIKGVTLCRINVTKFVFNGRYGIRNHQLRYAYQRYI